jgi:NADH:ubiquinone reductase (H+-translocating)
VQSKEGTKTRIEAVCKVWAAGVQASPLAKQLAEQTGAPLDRAGRIGVNPDTTLPGHPDVFVIGDMMSLDNLPGVAQVAIQQGKYAAHEIKNRLMGKAPQKPFKYFDKGSMATISRFSAVALIGKIRLTGLIAWLMWLAIHLVYLTGFKNRFATLVKWFVTFVSNDRSERAATEQQIFGRLALGKLEHGAADLVTPPGEWNRIREELVARAQEEARLTDSGQRGVRRETVGAGAGTGDSSNTNGRISGA